MNREKVIFPEEMVRRHPPLYDKCFYGNHQQNIQRNYRKVYRCWDPEIRQN